MNKILPYLRFIWGTLMIINFVFRTSSMYDDMGLNIIGGLFITTFTTYCFITGIEELKNKEFINARFFRLFGIVFEIIIFAFGFILFKSIVGQSGEIWRIAILTLWQIGLIALIFADIRRIFAIRQRTI